MSTGERPISYSPTEGLSYDPSDAVYWNRQALDQELERTFEVCHGCRMCFKFCDSFPSLFRFIDERHGGDVSKLTGEETQEVVDACFQCKLCEVQCPYTVRDEHEYQLDFPRLIHRYKAIRAREGGISLRERILGDPDRTAAMARSSLGIANRMNRVAIHRWFMEKLLNIHRDKLLPDFAQTTFESWAGTAGVSGDGIGDEVALFPTCYVQNNEPEVGRDTVEVLQRNQVKLSCPKGLKCCGMPAWESGDLEGLRKNARHNLDLLSPAVEAGAKIVVINPTCSMMMRREYPELLEGKDRERAIQLAEAIRDAGEYLWSIRKEERFNTNFLSTPGDVAYHAPCHLRAQGVGFKGRDLLRKIPGCTPSSTLECCGHDGTYAMKVEGFEPSARIGAKAFDGLKEHQEAEVWSTDCPLAAIQFEQHAGRRPLHPMSILARAYREDGFPTRITSADEKESE